MSYCSIQYAVQFVQKHRADSAYLAQLIQVPTENILGLAAHESQHGQGRIAVDDNNYFSMHAPAPFQIGDDVAKGNIHLKVVKYSSYLQSGQSFIARYGAAVKGKSEPTDFSQALIAAHFNSGNPKTGGTTDYAKKIVDSIHMVKLRMGCQ